VWHLRPLELFLAIHPGNSTLSVYLLYTKEIMPRRPTTPGAAPAKPAAAAVADNIARLTLDLVSSDEVELGRLRGLLNAVGSRDVESGATGSASLLRKIEIGEALKKQIAEAKLEKADARKPAPILASRLLISNKAPQTGAGALAAVCCRCRQ